jgi:hypothetical protein
LPETDYAWRNTPLNVLDCVLSLNRHYDSFCFPRVEQFGTAHPEVDTLDALRRLIREYDSPNAFSIAELDYNHAERAQTLLEVTEFLIKTLPSYPGSTEMERAERWAVAARPADYAKLGIRGFGLAGFQYLRMLLGAQTTKPDTHICRFVESAVGRRVSATEALALLEAASKRTGHPLRELDYAIWEDAAPDRA